MAGDTYAHGRQGHTLVGGFLIVTVSILSAALLVAALIYAAGEGPRRQDALAGAGCEPNLSPSDLPCTTVWTLSGEFTGITGPAGQRMSFDVAAYTESERDDLAVAEAALRAQVTTENALDASLAQFPFPPAIAPTATALIRDDYVLAELTARQAQSSSLAQMRSLDGQVQAAGAVVQSGIALIHKEFETRPTASQEP